MGCYNPRRVSSINMCDRHGTDNHKQSQATITSMLSPPSLLRHQNYFISFVNVHLLGEQVSEIIILGDSTPRDDE
jgi:hypothetical protein